MAVVMAVATMGRDDAAAGEECAGSDELPDEAWREITVAEGSQGPRSYMFSAQRVRVTRTGKPGEEAGAVYRRNLDGSEPRYYLSNAPEDTMLETLAYVGGSRWRIESEFETEKGDVGLDEYETRSWAGWHHHIAMCLLGLQQNGGKRCPGTPVPRCTGWCGRCCPGSGSGRTSCCYGWWSLNYVTSRHAAPPAVKAGWSRHPEPVIVVLGSRPMTSSLPKPEPRFLPLYERDRHRLQCNGGGAIRHLVEWGRSSADLSTRLRSSATYSEFPRV